MSCGVFRRVWCLGGPGGVQGADVGEIFLSIYRLLGSFRLPFLRKTTIRFMLFFDCFSGCHFYGFLVILGVLFRGFWSGFSDIFGNCELVEISTPLERQLDFQGLAGFGSACFVLFFGVWFLDGFGN